MPVSVPVPVRFHWWYRHNRNHPYRLRISMNHPLHYPYYHHRNRLDDSVVAVVVVVVVVDAVVAAATMKMAVEVYSTYVSILHL